MKRIILLVFTLFMAYGASAQISVKKNDKTENKGEDTAAYFITHKVLPGEQVIMISRKYLVEPKDIYEFNKDAVNGVAAGTMLIIPLHKSHKSNLQAFIKQLEKEKGGSIRVASPVEKDQARL